MYQNAVNAYKNVQVRTSNPGELLLALYDGIFRFLTVAKTALQQGKKVQAMEACSRVFAILTELYSALDYSKAPDLCQNLASVYDFCMDRTTKASRQGDIQAIDEIVRVMTPIRDGFREAVKIVNGQNAQAQGAPPASSGSPPKGP